MRKISAAVMMFFLFTSVHSQTGISNLEDLKKVYPDNPDEINMPEKLRQSTVLKGMYSVKELQEDFLQFRKCIEDIHPSPYAFTPKESFDEAFQAQYEKIDKPMSQEEFYCLLAPLKGKIGDGHAHLDYPEEYRRTVQNHKFPLTLSFLDDRCYVRKDLHEEPSLPLFSEILSIDGIAIERIADTLRAEIGADGHNRFFKTASLENCFQYYYANHYGAPEEFRLGYRTHENGDVREAVVPAIPCSGINYSNKEPRALDVQLFPKNSAAVLTIESFSYYGERNKIFFAFIDRAFARIKEEKIENVILDLRGNGGGDPFCAGYLWAYIEREPQPYFSRSYRRYEELSKPIVQADDPFSGKIFILIDGGIFSTSGHFCALVKYHDRAAFIGTETGGTYTCNAAVKVYALNNTGIGLKLATGSYAAAVEGFPQDRGIIPDHNIEPTIEDIKNGRDPVLDYALKLTASRDQPAAAGEGSRGSRLWFDPRVACFDRLSFLSVQYVVRGDDEIHAEASGGTTLLSVLTYPRSERLSRYLLFPRRRAPSGRP